MTDREDELTHLRGLQAKHRKNVRMLEEMLANYGMERPLPLLNNLEFERAQLRQVGERLAAALAAQAGTEEAPADTVEPAADPRAAQVTVPGSGAAAAGGRATSTGMGGVAVGGDVHGGVHISGRSNVIGRNNKEIGSLRLVRTLINRMQEEKGKHSPNSTQYQAMHHTQQDLETLFRNLQEVFNVPDNEAPLT
jgi:hypothetical protein